MEKVTLEKLAKMVAQGFEGVDKQFGEVHEELGGIHEELEGIHEELGLVRARVDSIEMELIDIRKKLDNIVYRHEYETLKDRVAVLEKRLKSAK